MRHVKASGDSRPILMMSAETSEQDLAAAYAAGCDDYLPKPFRASELVRRVQQLLLRRTPDRTTDSGVACRCVESRDECYKPPMVDFEPFDIPR